MPDSPDQAIDAERVTLARTALACAAIDAAEFYANLAELTLDGEDPRPGELTSASRRGRLLAIVVTTHAVWHDVLTGGWPLAAEVLGMAEADARRLYQPDFDRWTQGRPASPYPGLRPEIGTPASRWSTRPRELRRQLARWLNRRRATQDAAATTR